MEFPEKVLYHQVHPIKLLADWGTGLAARLAGLAFVWGGAWVRRPPWIAFGLAVIVAAWARGMLWPSSSLNSRGRSDAQ